MRSLKRRWFWIIIGFMALVSLSVILTPYGLGYSIKRYFLANGADYASVGDVDFNPFTRRLAIYNLEVSVDQQNVLKIPEASFLVSGSPLFKKHFHLRRAAFKDIELTLAELEAGRWQIGGLLLTDSKEKSDSFAWGFGLRELNFTNSRIKLRSSRLSSDITIEKAQIARLASWMPNRMAQVDFSGKINDGRLQFQGDFAAFGKEQKFIGKIKIGNLNLAPFKRAASPYLTKLDGQLDADLNVDAKQMASGLLINQKGRLTLRQISVQAEKIDFSDEQFNWDGTMQVSIAQTSGDLKLETDGQIDGTLMSIAIGNEDLRLQHEGLNWNGKFALDQNSEENHLDFDGKLKLQNFKMDSSDLNLADEDLSWEGTIQFGIPQTSGQLQIEADGQIDGTLMSMAMGNEDLRLQHEGLNWNGKFALTRKPETSELKVDGALKLQNFKLAASDVNLAEESLTWDGGVQIEIPTSPDAFLIEAAGQLEGQGSSLNSTSENLAIQHSGLNWNGKFTFATKQETADTRLEGELKLGKLEIATSDLSLTEEDLTWNGSLQIFLPENGETQRLTTNGKLESKHQTIAFLRENLNLTNENLLWEGQFNCGLKDFNAGLAAEGDFSLTDLAMTATHKKLRLLASKAVSLKSIKGDAGSQFSIATAKITGLDLVGETGSPENGSLFSASEVTVDNVKLERLKQVSIQSARIIAAKGVLHHKSDGRWLYIDDLTTFLADSGSSSQRKPSQNKTAEKTQPPSKEEDVEFGIRIGSLEIVGDSVLHFEDETVNPTFNTDVGLKEARLTGVDSFQPEQSSPFAFEALSRKYTRLKLQGNVQPFRERISMDLKGKIKAAEMPPLSPYAVKTLGYNLVSGEMDADIGLKIILGKMEGEGDLKFYDPEIEAVDPEKFKNEAGKSIPLQSALEVLRDKDNNIRLKIPISGDVTDPKFSFADAINQALIKGLSMATLSYLKYMLGPYGMAIGIIELGVKVGAKALPGIRLKPVEFQFGASDLDPGTMEYLDKVAAILKEKKDLRLRLCGWATESERMEPREAAEIPTAPPGAVPLGKKSAPDGETDAPKDARFPLSDEAMLALAERRAGLMEDILVNQHGIKAKRIFICKPQIDKNPDAKPRVELVF